MGRTEDPAESAMDSSQRGMSLRNAEEFRRYAHQMVDFAADYYRDIESFPVRSTVEPGYLKPLLPDSAPEDPESLDDVLSDVRTKIFPGVTHWQSPSFFGYYPSNSSTAGYLGEMLSGCFNVVGFSWITCPAATELETIVLDWLGKLLQLPPQFLSTGDGGGVIQGTASEAVAVALLAARRRALDKLMASEVGESEAMAAAKLVAYTSDQAHSCVQKAANIAGLGSQLRVLRTDASTNFELSPSVLSKAVAHDIAEGLVPFFVCATVGTTSSAAVDPISAVGDEAIEHGMWFHVDGAYAGSACICPELRHHLDGVEKADSFCMNAHKWLLTNFDCSALWVKDSKPLVAALSTYPEYFRNKASDAHKVVDYKDWQLPLGRRFRALKLWFVLRLYGAAGLRKYIRNHVAWAQRLSALVESSDKFELLAPPKFSLVCFRLKPLRDDPDDGATANMELLEAVNCSGKALLSHTVLDGITTLRFAIGSTVTTLQHVEDAWALVTTEADRLTLKKPARLATVTSPTSCT